VTIGLWDKKTERERDRIFFSWNLIIRRERVIDEPFLTNNLRRINNCVADNGIIMSGEREREREREEDFIV